MRITNAILSPAKKSAELEQPHGDAVALSSKTLDTHYLFYCFTCGQNVSSESADDVASPDKMAGDLSAPYSCAIWRPGIWPSLPPGLSDTRLKLRFLFRWTVHRLHLFAGSGCGALLVYDRERLVHYSGFTPGYWRFPFIVGDDFQIGDTWTDPAYRRRGLALFALRTVVTELARPGRRLWYVVEAINEASIRVAEKAQFKLTADGVWKKPWGFKLAGAYVIRTNRSA